MSMRAYLEHLIETAEPTKDGVKAAQVQLHFRNSSIMPTPQGVRAANAMAGGLAAAEVPGIFKLLTVGSVPNENGRGEHPAIIEIVFAAEDIFRVDRVAKHLEEQKIVPAGGQIVTPH